MTAAGPGPRIEPRWWGWGDPTVPTELPDKAKALLLANGLTVGDHAPAPDPASVELPQPKPIPREVVEAAGESLDTAPETRLRHSGGHSFPDLIRRRSGDLVGAPDGVVTPEDDVRLRKVLEACSRSKVAVVPWGGGTSVTGGLTVREEGFAAVVAIDMGSFVAVEIDSTSMTARLGAGLRGPEVEAALRREGLTLGHFPQSFEYATVGGFAAARSAGQASSGYGRFDDMVVSVRLVAPNGEIQTIAGPRTSSGPSIREVVLGSEGTLGVITDVTVRVEPTPRTTRYEAALIRDFESGCSAARDLAQSGCLPTVLRVSDADETAVSIGMSRPGGIPGRLFDRWLRLRSRSAGSLVITGYEGLPASVRASRSEVRKVLARAGAVGLGRAAGRSWQANRFHGPYLREALLDHGLIVDTFETSALWRDYATGYRSIRKATSDKLADSGMKGVVMCHLSHCYPESASLYFTVIANSGPEGSIASWEAVKTSAMEAITEAGMTVSHHHGVGRDHARWLEKEVGESGVALLRSIKETLDPEGIMNPGCLLAVGSSGPRRPG